VPISENRQKLIIEVRARGVLGGFTNQDLAKRTNRSAAERREPVAPPALDQRKADLREKSTMLGKIAGALIGRRVAGRNSGAKGALIGAGIAALARRGLGPLAAVAAIGWGAKKLYERRGRRSPSYPSEATPSSPES
jgi:hypothetical protein